MADGRIANQLKERKVTPRERLMVTRLVTRLVEQWRLR